MTSNPIKLTIEHEIRLERIADLLETGLNGANYWASAEETADPSAWTFRGEQKFFHDYPLNPNGAIIIEDMEAGMKEHRLDFDAVKRGLAVMAKDYPQDFADFLKENDDMNTGDILIQCALFGEVKYG